MRRSMVLVAATALLATASPFASASATEPEAVALAGVTDLVAERTASSVPVSIARDVTLAGTCLRSPAVAVTGTASTVLAQLDSVTDGSGNGSFLFGQLPDGSTFDDLCGSRVIPAGPYRLTVLRTDGDATMRLFLPGIDGTTTIFPTDTSEAKVAALPQVSPDTVTSVTASFGRTLELSGPGSTVVVGGVTSRLGGSVVRSTCEYSPGTPAAVLPALLAYSAPCPAGAASRGLGVGGSSITIGTATGREPGVYGLGFYYVGAGQLAGSAVAATFPSDAVN